MNKDMYIDILRPLRGAVRRKRRETWRIDCWFLLHDNAPAHWSLLVKEFLAKNNLTTLENRPYPSDMAPTDFYLFAGLKSALTVLVMDFFLAKSNVTTLENPPYPSDMAATDFYFFAGLKSALKGRRFCEATKIIKNATEELKRVFYKIARRNISSAFI